MGARRWGSLATILAVTVALVLGAGAAAYAALSKKERKAAVVTTTVAQATTPTAAPTTPTPPAGFTTPTTSTPTVPGITKPPAIPLKAATPTSGSTSTPTTSTSTSATGEENDNGSKETSSTGTGGSGSESQPEPILLDTDAASTYNPYGYPASGFGDPSLTIDGDTSTGWSAQVIPASAPKLAEGVLIDLHTAQKVSSIKLVTSTPGMTVQVYGANGHTVPASITDPAWATLSRSIMTKKHHVHIGLRNRKKAYRYYVLWISRAGAASVGTPEAPGHVSVNELELFPAASS